MDVGLFGRKKARETSATQPTGMDSSDPYEQLSGEAREIFEQLIDIAHDEGSPDAAGIEWPVPDEEPPYAALEELQAAGVCRWYRQGESVFVELTPEAGRRYV